MTDAAEHAPARPAAERDRSASPLRRSARRWWRRRPINRALVVLHRWPALILGLFLVIECSSGAVLVYHAELYRTTSGSLYQHSSATTPVSAEQALDLVAREHPSYGASWVGHDDGVYVVGNTDYNRLYFVDPGNGHINGSDETNRGFLAWMVNLHDCAFTCAGFPWTAPWLSDPVWINGPSFLTDITWANIILGVLGVLMIVLVLTSLKIWWPGLRKLGTRFTVRHGKGRFARDFDLHNVLGAIALPFLLMWGVTGAALEFPGIEKAWLAITAGSTADAPDFSLTTDKTAAKDPAISFDAAVATALHRVPGRAAMVYRPTQDTPWWEIDVDTDYGSSRYRAFYNGDAYVLVDPHDAAHAKVISAGRGEPAGNRFYDKYFEPAHFGWQVNPWWRAIWFVLGLMPLILFVTGVSTWQYRLAVKRRRRKALAARDPVITPVDDLDAELQHGHADALDPDQVSGRR